MIKCGDEVERLNDVGRVAVGDEDVADVVPRVGILRPRIP